MAEFFSLLLLCASYQTFATLAVFWLLVFPAVNDGVRTALLERVVRPGVRELRRFPAADRAIAWDRARAALTAASDDASKVIGDQRRAVLAASILLGLLLLASAFAVSSAPRPATLKAAALMVPVYLVLVVLQLVYVGRVVLASHPISARHLVDRARVALLTQCFGSGQCPSQ